MHADRKSSEFQFPVAIGAGFQIEPPDSRKAIRDVNFDSSGIHWFAINGSNGQLHRARPDATVHDGNFLRHMVIRYLTSWIRFRLWLSEAETLYEGQRQ